MSAQDPAPKVQVNGDAPPKPGDAPEEVVSKVKDAIAPVAGVASSNEPPGAPAVKVGTAVPVAALAKKDASDTPDHPIVSCYISQVFHFMLTKPRLHPQKAYV